MWKQYKNESEKKLLANSLDPDQTALKQPYDLGLNGLLRHEYLNSYSKYSKNLSS